ncbi:MAG: STAS domain-containing protein [Planctomycetota bacterium]|jgi:anti-anti-sigma factor|nr:STAS domain-containing protein [Planctomycetota bacterium]
MDFRCEPGKGGPGSALILLEGQLDAGTAISFEAVAADCLADPSVKKVILDMTGLTFISSSGLRVIMFVVKKLMPRGGKLYLAGASSQVVNLLKMSGMTRLVEFRDTAAAC